MMCDKCGAKSADVELYCKNCGSDLQIFGAGVEKVKITSDAKEEGAAAPAAASPMESPLGPPPSGAFPPLPGAESFRPPPGTAPGLTPSFSSPAGQSPAPDPGSFENLPSVPSPGQTPPSLSGAQDAKTNPEDVPSFISRSVPPSAGKPFTPPGEPGSGEPVDFSFLGKRAEQSPEAPEAEEEKPAPSPSPPAPSPGTFSPDFFKPKEDK